MNHYLLYHRHASSDCAAAFAAWNAFSSELSGATAMSSCPFGAHEIWWWTEAADLRAALTRLPKYVAERTLAIRVEPLTTG